VIDGLAPRCGRGQVRVFRRGNSVSEGSHHPERSGCGAGPTSPQAIGTLLRWSRNSGTRVHFSATSIEMVRGILVTAHLFVKEGITGKGDLEDLPGSLRQGTFHPAS